MRNPEPAFGRARLGRSGCGHFVKMVDVGTESRLTQACGEGFQLRRKSEHELDIEAAPRS
jgi:6-phosphogluconate dehydrogenase